MSLFSFITDINGFFENVLLYACVANNNQNKDIWLREKCPYSKLFWSTFSRIRTEYGEILISLRIQSECGEIRTRKTPNTNTFRAVFGAIYWSFLYVQCWRGKHTKTWLYVLIMSCTRFRVIPHSIVAWMSRNSLLEIGVKSEVRVTTTGLEPTTT